MWFNNNFTFNCFHSLKRFLITLMDSHHCVLCWPVQELGTLIVMSCVRLCWRLYLSRSVWDCVGDFNCHELHEIVLWTLIVTSCVRMCWRLHLSRAAWDCIGDVMSLKNWNINCFVVFFLTVRYVNYYINIIKHNKQPFVPISSDYGLDSTRKRSFFKYCYWYSIFLTNIYLNNSKRCGARHTFWLKN